MADRMSFPTVLIALQDARIQEELGLSLRNRGYLVLEAASLSQAFEIVRTHSRRIHLSLLGPGSRVMAGVFKQYRSHMKILFIEAGASEPGSDQISPETAMETIQTLVSPPAAAMRAG
ncbi:MAG TPA: hypothetical protein VLW65_01635 [Bryobacteraceae bacterium]|nr:hypothetical protein [Bryobacteraceae bacterium]